MAQLARFFDSEGAPGGDRVYDASEWAAIFNSFIREGYIRGYADGLEVVESSPPAMSVRVRTGAAFIQGRHFEVTNASESLTIAANGSGNPRIDRVVVRLDLSARTIALHVIQGTPAASPSAPAITRSGSIYDISLARVAVASSASSISTANITDERSDSSVSGEARLGSVWRRGDIKMWSGAVTDIEEGWALCDGTNGTPNLVDRFIVGAGGEYAVGATGGLKQVSLTTAQMPSHTHSGPSHTHGMNHSHTLRVFTVSSSTHAHSTHDTGAAAPNNPYGSSTNTNTFGASAVNTDAGGTGNTGATGSGAAHENRPPFYALCFLMKL